MSFEGLQPTEKAPKLNLSEALEVESIPEALGYLRALWNIQENIKNGIPLREVCDSKHEIRENQTNPDDNGLVMPSSYDSIPFYIHKGFRQGYARTLSKIQDGIESGTYTDTETLSKAITQMQEEMWGHIEDFKKKKPEENSGSREAA